MQRAQRLSHKISRARDGRPRVVKWSPHEQRKREETSALAGAIGRAVRDQPTPELAAITAELREHGKKLDHIDTRLGEIDVTLGEHGQKLERINVTLGE